MNFLPKNKAAFLANPSEKIKLGAALVGVSALVAVSPSQAQTATIDVPGVAAQTSAATTAISTVGAILLPMAFGLLVFKIASRVIKYVMSSK